ncbi:MAG: hypothetical protein EZS28_015379 [Streblomastix strix]|uniref:Uncharacterized protein n=1 Tax=Streblomastix strix TaxID=222440 RepID=A0A5J4W2I3_9EUKA|nr:MAG: hypothetical protein EZS28_015379 [Streblomastix strix]
MSSLGLQIICSDSDSDYVQWKTSIPSGCSSFQDYLEIEHNLTSSPARKFYEQSVNGDGTYKLTAITGIPKIRINFNTTINNKYTNETNSQGYLYSPLLITINTSNRGAIYFNNAANEHTQKLSDAKFSLNINEAMVVIIDQLAQFDCILPQPTIIQLRLSNS